MVTVPPGVVPVRALTTGEILTGDRVTSYRWEVLTHSSGSDHLLGVLDGVDGTPTLTWAANTAVKGSGSMRVADLPTATPGTLRIGELSLESVRLRPVCVIEGLPEIPLSVFLVTGATEEWSATGRTWALELHDRATVLDQDRTEVTFAVAAGANILGAVKSVIESAGEAIDVDGSVTLTLAAPMVWPVNTSKLQIVNDLLSAAGYASLWVDGQGAFQATPYQLPAQRSIHYEMLDGLPRELVYGERSIYSSEWARNRDSFDVPNKVVAVQSAGSGSPAIIAVWMNEDPTSPYSYQARGRWITLVLDGVDVPNGTEPEIIAALEAQARAALVAASSVQATVSVTCLPIPVQVSDAIRFEHTPAAVDARHTVTQISLDAHPLGLMRLALQEVVDL